jgi:hypothetical protein
MPINEKMKKKYLLMPLILLIGACANNPAMRLEEPDYTLSEYVLAITGEKEELPAPTTQVVTHESEFFMPEGMLDIAHEDEFLLPEETQFITHEPEFLMPEALQITREEVQAPVEMTALPFIELPPKPSIPEYILGQGQIDAEILSEFLVFYHPEIYYLSPELANLYVEEAALEGISHDVAFAQMCLETGFLRFGGIVLREMNNFCGLGAIGPGQRGEWFPDERTGVRAHIQHLKAYATEAPLNQELVDPRYTLVHLGSAPNIGGLAGTWAADIQYGQKINSILERLYEFSFQRKSADVY